MTGGEQPLVSTINIQQVSRLSLRRNFSWSFAGNLFYAACQWGVLVTIARLTSPEEVGQFAFGLAVTAPLFLFANLSLRIFQTTDAKSEYRFSDYLGIRLATSLAALGIVVAVAFGAASSASEAAVLGAIGLSKAMDAVSDIIHGLFQSEERLDLVAKSLITNGSLSLGFLAITLIATDNLVTASFAYASASLVTLVFYNVPVAHQRLESPMYALGAHFKGTALVRLLQSWRSTSRSWPQLALSAFPLGLTALLTSLTVGVPVYVLERQADFWDVGVFSALSYLVLSGNTLIGALAQSSLPRMALYHAKGDATSFKSLLTKLEMIAVGLGAIAIALSVIAGDRILTLIYGSEYGQYKRSLILLTAAVAFSFVAWFFDNVAFSARAFSSRLPIQITTLVSTTAAAWLLVPSHGIHGAAGATCIGMFVQFALKGITAGYVVRQLSRAQPTS